MLSKIVNWMDRLQPHKWKDPMKKKHNRKSISWHKRRILARLNPKVNKSQKIEILQLAGAFDKKSSLQIRITNRHGHNTTHSIRRQLVQEHHRIVKALRYLIAEGKIKSSMTTKEWDIQLALGTAEVRTFTLVREE